MKILSLSLLTRAASTLLLLMLLACSPSVEPDDDDAGSNITPEISLTFGIYASADPSELVRQFRPILRQLEMQMTKRLKQDVVITLVLTRTYDIGVESIVNGNFDLTRTGPASYLRAHSLDPNISIIAMESVGGRKVFNGVIAVHRDSNITNITELKGAKFAFGSESSTIGRYLSQMYLAENGIKAADIDFEYLGRHDKVGKAVGDGLFVAGALNESTFERLVANGVPIKVLATFENTTKPWFVSSVLDDDITRVLSEELLKMNNTEALTPLKIDGFLPGDHSNYEAVQKAIYQNHLFFD